MWSISPWVAAAEIRKARGQPDLAPWMVTKGDPKTQLR
jgi:hypothetical protein